MNPKCKLRCDFKLMVLRAQETVSDDQGTVGKLSFHTFRQNQYFSWNIIFCIWNFIFFKEMLKNSKSFPTLKNSEILKNPKNISKSVFEQRYNPLRSYPSNNLVVCKKLGLRVQFENFRFLRTFSRWWKSLREADWAQLAGDLL